MLMKPALKTFDADQESYTLEGCYINELSNSGDDVAVSIARARVKPGITTRWHWLAETDERYVILSGEGLMEVGDLPAQSVRPGDVVLIPSQIHQRITNTGADDLVFLAICSPRFAIDNYHDLQSNKQKGP